MATRITDPDVNVVDAVSWPALLAHLPMGAMVAEAPSGRIVSVNVRAEQIWRGEVPRPRSIEEYTAFRGYRPNGRQYAADEWPLARAVRDAETVVDEEIAVLLGGGARRILQVSATPVRGRDHEVQYAIAFFSDVTDRRQAQRRRDFLFELGDELRGLEDAVAIMEAAAAATGEQLGVSSASWADIEAGGRRALVHAEYRNGRIAPPRRYHLEEFGPLLLEQLRAGETLVIEDISADPRATGDPYDLWGIRSLIAVPLTRHGHFSALFTVLHDAPRAWSPADVALVQQVAERTRHAVETARTQADLRQSREWLTLALRAGSAAIWEWDLRTGEIHWSEEHDALLGLSSARRSLTFTRWLALVHPDDRASARAAARRIATMREGEVELEYRLAGGARWITMRGRIIADTRGVPRRVVGVAVDTTERKGTELEREELLRQAREASETKSHFISVISHEFRTPLTAIIGYADLLSSGISGSLAPVQERQLERIRASAWHLTQLVDEILTFSRIEAGRETVSLGPVDLCAVARECADLIAPSADDKELALVCDLPADPVMLRTDGGKIRQILLNLLGNAVKFTDRGSVTLRLRRIDGAVQCAVIDTGVGIPPEDVSRIFELFWQGQQRDRIAAGAGLGLTVSRQLADLLDGDIAVESEPGTGSTFTLTLRT